MTLGARRQPRETLSALDRITEIIGSVLYRLAGPQPTKTRHRVAFRGMSENVSGTFEKAHVLPLSARRPVETRSVCRRVQRGRGRIRRRRSRVSARVPNPFQRPPRLNALSKPTIFIAPGSNSSPSGRCTAASLPTTAMSRSRDLREREVRAHYVRSMGYGLAVS
jgi:hypothetical protein